MAQSSGLAAYAYTYFEVYQKAVQEPTRILYESKHEAQKARLALYGFRRALLKEPDADPELAALIPGVRIYLEEHEGRWSLRLTDQDPIGTSLAHTQPA